MDGIGEYAFDDELLAAVQGGAPAQLKIYTLDQTVVVLGRGSRPELELDLAACRADGIPVLRRRGGGCSVVVDPGNAIVSTVLPLEGYGSSATYMRSLSAWLMDGLRRLGLGEVGCAGVSDLVLGDRKISGACIYRARGLLYYSATLLVNPEPSLLGRYLSHPPREPGYRAGRGHAEFVGRIALPGLESAPALVHALRGTLAVPSVSELAGEGEKKACARGPGLA